MVTRTALDPWNEVEHAVLAATREPSTCRQVADRTGLTPDLAQAQLEVLRDAGLLAQVVSGGVRHHLTLAGWKRLAALTCPAAEEAA